MLLDYLRVLQPQNIPTSDVLRRSLNESLREDCAPLRSKGAKWASNQTGARNLNQVLNIVPFLPTEEAQIGSGRADKIHDEYFHIKRVDGDASEVFVRMLLSANWLLLRDVDEMPFTIGRDRLDLLDAAFVALLSWALGANAIPAARVSHWRSSAFEHNSMRRWIRGHQIFAALTQGLIAALRELAAGLLNEDDLLVGNAVDLAVVLLRASGAALEFTGDLPAGDYCNLIRPSMMPPQATESLSGLLSVDHRYLVQLLREMKPLLDSLQGQNPSHHQRIADALRSVYDSHKFVCDRLVGKAPSLMMATSSAHSGAEQIEKFKNLRMKVFQTDEKISGSILSCPHKTAGDARKRLEPVLED